MENVGGLILIVVIYFLPALVASHRKHKNRLAILMTNLLLGITGIGWFVALIWACSANVEEKAKA